MKVPFAAHALSCLVLLFFANSLYAQPKAKLGFSPDRYFVELTPGGSTTESLMVKNLSDKPMTVKVSVGRWEMDEENRVRELPPSSNSLDRWIVINPARVTIPPNTPQTIRWAIVPRSQPAPGEHRAIIFIEEDLQARESGATASVRVNMRLGIPIYAQVGEAIDSARITNVSLAQDQQAVELTLLNEGNRHARLKGRYGIWPADSFPGKAAAMELLAELPAGTVSGEGFSAFTLADVVVLPSDQRNTRVVPELPGAGEFVMQFYAEFGDVTLSETLPLSRGQ